MDKLVERVEAAEGPDRMLDALIAHQVGAPYGSKTEWANRENGDYIVIDQCALPYTASLDAAMSLVSEGSEISLTNLYGVARATVDMNGEFGGFNGEHLGGNMTLALVAACLKARAILHRGEG